MSEPAAAQLPPEPPVDTRVPAGRRLVGVQFRRASVMVYDFDARGFDLPHDARVVVETDRGEALGWTVGVPEHRAPHGPDEVRRILRLATPQDLARDAQLHERERVSLRHCAQRARQLGLPMKVVAAEWQHSGDKVTFYFSSEDRVDFRQLVRDLAQQNRARVEMRQVGPRDETKIIGAMGPCGRETCCSSWMRSFTQVSIRHAKDQGLGLNPAKVTGVCGRLMCCLAYEQETYQELRKGLPKYGKMVSTPMGPGKVVDVLALRRAVRVSVEGRWMEFAADEVTPLNGPPGTGGDDEGEQTQTAPTTPSSAPMATPGVRPDRNRMGDRPTPNRDVPRPQGSEARGPRPERTTPPPRPEGPPSAGQTPRSPTDRSSRHERRPQQSVPDASSTGPNPAEPPQARPPRPPKPPNDNRPKQEQKPASPPSAPPAGDGDVAADAQAPGVEGERQRRRRRGRRGRGGGGGGGGPGDAGGPADGGSSTSE